MYTIGIIEYYLNLAVTWFSQYVMFLYNKFMGFSFIIKVAAISVTLSVLLILFTLLRILWNGRHVRKWNKEYKKMDKKYGDGIRYILSKEAKDNMTRDEVLEAMGIKDEDRNKTGTLLKNYREKLTFARLTYRSRISKEASLGRRKNLHVMLNAFEMPVFLENTINKGKMRHKAEALNMMRAFKLPVNQWIANQLRNSKRYRVRRLSQYASIMSSSNTDLEYFESEFFDRNCCIYDEIQLGYVLRRRQAMKRKLPNLAQLANNQSKPETQIIFVKLLRKFEQKEFCADLEELFNSTSDKDLIQEICRTWGYMHYLPGEELMQDIFLTQSDDTKVTIMHSLARLRTGKSLNIFVDGYRNSGAQHMRYESLRCLYNYGQVGFLKFKELEASARDDEKGLFDFFNNPLTRANTKLQEKDVYQPNGAENLYSVV